MEWTFSSFSSLGEGRTNHPYALGRHPNERQEDQHKHVKNKIPHHNHSCRPKAIIWRENLKTKFWIIDKLSYQLSWASFICPYISKLSYYRHSYMGVKHQQKRIKFLWSMLTCLSFCYRLWKVKSQPGLKPKASGVLCQRPNHRVLESPDILTDSHTPVNLVTFL